MKKSTTITSSTDNADTPIRNARRIYSIALIKAAATVMPRLMELIEDEVIDQSSAGISYITFDIEEDFELSLPQNTELLITQYIVDALESDGCEIAPGSVETTLSYLPDKIAPMYNIRVTGAFELIDSDNLNMPTDGMDLLKEVKKLIETRKRKREESDGDDHDDDDDDTDEPKKKSKKKARKE